jgi:hypothetical protein
MEPNVADRVRFRPSVKKEGNLWMTKAGEPKKPRKSRALITENLKKVYQQTEEEKIPDALMDLVERLKRSDEEGENQK